MTHCAHCRVVLTTKTLAYWVPELDGYICFSCDAILIGA